MVGHRTRDAVFYIDQSGIILAKVGTGRDISRPKNPRSGPVGIYPDQLIFGRDWSGYIQTDQA